jgi:hypothetical protein
VIYVEVEPGAPLSQGDILDDCPILFWEQSAHSGELEAMTRSVRVVVLTQACDLAQTKANRVLVATIHEAKELVERMVLKESVIRDHVRTHRVCGWYFLPRGITLPESIVDLRDLHTIPRSILERLIREGKRVTRISTPYREHLSQHFSTTYSRIGLPEPYGSEGE